MWQEYSQELLPFLKGYICNTGFKTICKHWGKRLFHDQLPVCAQIVALLCLLATDIWCRLSLPYEIQGSKWKTGRCPFGKEVHVIMKLNTVMRVFLSRLSVCLIWTKWHFFCFTEIAMTYRPLHFRSLNDLCFLDIFSECLCVAWASVHHHQQLTVDSITDASTDKILEKIFCVYLEKHRWRQLLYFGTKQPFFHCSFTITSEFLIRCFSRDTEECIIHLFKNRRML